jgi:hypothetical protein
MKTMPLRIIFKFGQWGVGRAQSNLLISQQAEGYYLNCELQAQQDQQDITRALSSTSRLSRELQMAR